MPPYPIPSHPIQSPWSDKHPGIKGLRPPEHHAGQFHPGQKGLVRVNKQSKTTMEDSTWLPAKRRAARDECPCFYLMLQNLILQHHGGQFHPDQRSQESLGAPYLGAPYLALFSEMFILIRLNKHIQAYHEGARNRGPLKSEKRGLLPKNKKQQHQTHK